MQPDVTTRRSAGGRPRGDPASLRSTTIGVRVSAGEYATLRAKAAQLHMTPAQWLREAALARCLPSPPVAAINRDQYAELARLAANLNQLTRLANEGGRVTVTDDLLASITSETKRLRLGLVESARQAMIAKAIKGKGFRGALEYDLSKERGRVVDTNMEGAAPRELAREFGAIRKLRPNLGRAVLHVSLSAAPGETLTDDQWREIGQRYLHGMGLDGNQYLITRHLDTEREHVHLLVHRVRFDGEVTSDSHDYWRHEILMRVIERDFSLQPVRPSIEAERHAATKGEIEQGLRTGIASTRQRLQQLCDAAATTSRTYSDYSERLEAAGVELVPVTQLDGAKLSGLSYRLDGVTMKGSDLGKGYSPAGRRNGESAMKKTETLRQLAASANEKSIVDLETRIEALRQAKIESADQLASMLEPIAQAMAALTDETRITLDEIGQKSRAHSERFEREVWAAATAVLQAAAMANESAERVSRAGQSMELRHYLLVVVTGLLSAALVSAFWLWLAPTTVVNRLDSAQMAEYLRPAIEALKPSKPK
jgi:hypothetical protein